MAGTVDKISGLARHLIDTIIERIPIKDAARTSILSRKWMYVWSEIPHLVFDKQFFDEVTINEPHAAHKLVSTIDEILLLHRSSILKVTIYIPDIPYDWDKRITQWMSFLSKNGVNELSLDNHNQCTCIIPSNILDCSNLMHFKLRNFYFYTRSARALFYQCNLIDLHLEKIAFPEYMILGGYCHMPLLESLNFTCCTGIENFYLSAPKLKTFIATNSRHVDSDMFEKTPNLTTISIALGTKARNRGKGRTIKLNKFFSTVPKISKFSFDGFFLKLLNAGTVLGECPVAFNSLEHLEFSELMFDDQNQIYSVHWLLRCSLNLRKLDIRASEVRNKAMEVDLSCLEAPECMDQILNELRTIKMSSVKGLKAELFLIKRILFCSPSLEKIHVQYSTLLDEKEGFKISTKLRQFSRASTKAEIIYMKP